MIKRFFGLVLLFLFIGFVSLKAGSTKKQIEALRVSDSPVIDANLNDPVWETGDHAGEFIQVSPYNGSASRMSSQVRILYNDEALYIGAMLYDPNPDSIVTHLSKRDEYSLSDYFGIYLDPFNDGLTSYGFIVTAAGVQSDVRIISGSEDIEDENWDAVWESAVDVTEEGWIVEIKIPYSALRFPDENDRNWGMNFFRNIRRYRELSSWNYVNEEVNSRNTQAGVLSGLKDVKPPLRLSINPYAASYINKRSASDNPGYSLKGGLDLKYGLNESFTLDMMLIPDFGQVESDDEVLNLTPFETYYDEKRSFFMEGNEIFEKADIFYSRRIGGTPDGFYGVKGELKDNERILSNPQESQIINATKISGKTPSGISAGFLNAMTGGMFAEVQDTLSGDSRLVKTQEFRNYNVSVIEKSLPNNSYISLINTNVLGAGSPYFANVTGIDTKLANRENSHALFLKSAYSGRRSSNEVFEEGMYYDVSLGKISGNFLWSLNQRLETDNYNPNDLGFIRANNEFSNSLSLSYNIYEPFWKILRFYNRVYASHSTLYRPFEFSRFEVGGRTSVIFQNYLYAGISAEYSPEGNDWYEPRVAGRNFREPGYLYGRAFISSDYRKTFAIDADISYLNSSGYDYRFLGFGVSPRIRINDKFFVVYDLDNDIYQKSPGYIAHSSAEDSIYFGLRDINTLTNTFNANYTFNNRSSLSFRVRHYWSYLEYNNYFLLNEEGYLDPVENYTEPDRNYNAFNIDMVYSWFFAPGSELTIVWKNAIEADEELILNRYSDNFMNTLNSPQFNSISIKVLYYLDYQQLMKKIRG